MDTAVWLWKPALNHKHHLRNALNMQLRHGSL